jgi:hypothetical protein
VIFLCQPFIIIQFIYHPLSSISHDQPDFWYVIFHAIH